MKNIVSFLKDHLSLIAAIPLILGGLWQAVGLGTMSVSYLRFFSVTKLIADGIIILLVIAILVMTILIVRWVLPTVDESLN